MSAASAPGGSMALPGRSAVAAQRPGALLDCEAAVLGYAANMTYNGVHPEVHRCTATYAKGVKLTKAARKRLEQRLQRKAGLEQWAIEIAPPPTDQLIT